jgi:hypothetical protein
VGAAGNGLHFLNHGTIGVLLAVTRESRDSKKGNEDSDQWHIAIHISLRCKTPEISIAVRWLAKPKRGPVSGPRLIANPSYLGLVSLATFGVE